MMFKLLATGATALMSVGALIDLPQQSIADGKPGATVEGVKRAEIRIATPDLVVFNDDSAEPLRSAYVVLRQLRSERLEDRPRELTNRAVVIYRDGLKAFETGDEIRARTLGTASLNLARAVELARRSRQDAGPDPDLPPPPPVRVRIVQGDKLLEADNLTILPDLPPALEAEIKEKVVEGGEKKVEVRVLPRVRREIKVEGIKQGEGVKEVEGAKKKVETIIVEGKPKEDVLIATQDAGKVGLSGKVTLRALGGDEKRAFVVEAPKFQGNATFTLRDHLIQAPKLETRVQGQKFRAVTLDSAARARFELRRAYDGIRAAREKQKSDADAAVYLDAAKDLYNAARRDAEAGHDEQASELARAAESLAKVPGLLKGLKEEGQKAEGKVEEKSVETIIRKGDVVVEGHPEAKEARVIVRVAPKQGEGDDEAKEDKKKPVEEEQVVGIGVALKLEEGKLVVLQVLPDSPAAEGEKLKEGDRLIGIKTEDGETEAFEEKELGDIVKLIRGKPGTKVQLVVVPSGSEEKKVVELERRKLSVPRETSEGEKKEESGKEPQTFKFVVPGGGELQGSATIHLDPSQLGKLQRLETLKDPKVREKVESLTKELKLKLEGDDSPTKSKGELPPPIED
jgi:hypothetical protein